MNIFNSLNNIELVEMLRAGAVGVIPTDTLYGIVAVVTNQEAVEKIYKLKRRSPNKACIVLVGSQDQIIDKDAWSNRHLEITKQYWPGSVTIALPITSKTPGYLHRAENSLAYRLPDDKDLRALLLKTGPLVAPSANIEGQPPAADVSAAMSFFKNEVDFYVDDGRLEGNPSTLVTLKDGQIAVLRQGSVKI